MIKLLEVVLIIRLNSKAFQKNPVFTLGKSTTIRAMKHEHLDTGYSHAAGRMVQQQHL